MVKDFVRSILSGATVEKPTVNKSAASAANPAPEGANDPVDPTLPILEAHDYLNCPDVVTASEPYARRFHGPVGEYLLEVQRNLVMELASPNTQGSWRVLEVGGGHAQLTETLLRAGAQVWVQGSSNVCAARLESLQKSYPERLHFVKASILSLPFEDREFDTVIAVRLISHAPRYPLVVKEMTRVAKRQVIIDFAPRSSFNLLYPLLYALKRKLEGEMTRPFIRFHPKTFESEFMRAGFAIKSLRRQFFMPMVFHRTLKKVGISKQVEAIFEKLGLTNIFGSPAILLAEREVDRVH